MTAKFTPGPWRVRTGDMFGESDFFAPFGACGCCSSPWMNGDTEAQGEANARLIEAAPDLYAALEECVDWLVLVGTENIAFGDGPSEIVTMARAALALARGE